jgi:hypothetical protein
MWASSSSSFETSVDFQQAYFVAPYIGFGLCNDTFSDSDYAVSDGRMTSAIELEGMGKEEALA